MQVMPKKRLQLLPWPPLARWDGGAKSLGSFQSWLTPFAAQGRPAEDGDSDGEGSSSAGDQVHLLTKRDPCEWMIFPNCSCSPGLVSAPNRSFLIFPVEGQNPGEKPPQIFQWDTYYQPVQNFAHPPYFAFRCCLVEGQRRGRQDQGEHVACNDFRHPDFQFLWFVEASN